MPVACLTSYVLPPTNRAPYQAFPIPTLPLSDHGLADYRGDCVRSHAMREGGVASGFSRSPSGDSLQFVSLLLVIEL
jgi:hypothetical protein